MAMQIRNKEGQGILMSELDKEAAAFWGKEVEEKSYAHPGQPFTNPDNLEGIERTKAEFRHKMHTPNHWKDAIGWYISESKAIEYPDTMKWKDVMTAMLGNSLLNCFLKFPREEKESVEICDPFDIPTRCQEELIATLSYYKPYFDLIAHWEEKGYTPHRVEL